jgi:hypothetical protein
MWTCFRVSDLPEKQFWTGETRIQSEKSHAYTAMVLYRRWDSRMTGARTGGIDRGGVDHGSKCVTDTSLSGGLRFNILISHASTSQIAEIHCI